MRLRIHAITLCAALIMVGAFALTQQATAGNTTAPPKGGDCIVIDCPKSPGFWMNHPKAWPQEDIMPGICNADLICLMKAPVKGNKVLTFLPAFLAAYLNFINCGGPDIVIYKILEGYAWLIKYDGCEVRANSDAWQKEGECIYLILDAYNNGLL